MATTVGSTTVTYNDNTIQGTAYLGHGIQVFNSSGTFTTPPGITKLKVTAFGGGAGGATTSGAGSGAAGIAYLTVPGGTAISVTIGAGGRGFGANSEGGAAANANAGGATSFGNYVTAAGGAVNPGYQSNAVVPAASFTSNGTVVASIKKLVTVSYPQGNPSASPSSQSTWQPGLNQDLGGGYSGWIVGSQSSVGGGGGMSGGGGGGRQYYNTAYTMGGLSTFGLDGASGTAINQYYGNGGDGGGNAGLAGPGGKWYTSSTPKGTFNGGGQGGGGAGGVIVEW